MLPLPAAGHQDALRGSRYRPGSRRPSPAPCRPPAATPAARRTFPHRVRTPGGRGQRPGASAQPRRGRGCPSWGGSAIHLSTWSNRPCVRLLGKSEGDGAFVVFGPACPAMDQDEPCPSQDPLLDRLGIRPVQRRVVIVTQQCQRRHSHRRSPRFELLSGSTPVQGPRKSCLLFNTLLR